MNQSKTVFDFVEALYNKGHTVLNVVDRKLLTAVTSRFATLTTANTKIT